MIEKVVIPAAGNGNRLQRLTNGLPKELIALGNKRMIDYSIEEGLRGGIENFWIVINEHKEGIRTYINERYNQDMFQFFYQPKPLGLGDAIRYVEEWVSDSFGLILPDDIIISNNQPINELEKVHSKLGGTVIGIISVERTERYGVVIGEEIEDGLYLVKDLMEKPAHGTVKSHMVISGRYILTEGIFRKLNGPNERTGEIELTDALRKLLEQEDIYALLISGKRYDCGSEDGVREYLSYISGRSDLL